MPGQGAGDTPRQAPGVRFRRARDGGRAALFATSLLLPLAVHAQEIGTPHPAVPTGPATLDNGPASTDRPLDWHNLLPRQQEVLAPFAREWDGWPPPEREGWLALVSRIPLLPPDRKVRILRRISEWAALTPEERELARANYRLARSHSAEERARAWAQYRSLTREQRAILRDSRTSNTAAGHAGAATGLAKQAEQPLPRETPDHAAPSAAAPSPRDPDPPSP